MEFSPHIRIGTRNSDLALWQANQVKTALEQQGYSLVLVPIRTTGDLNRNVPFAALGQRGIFTSELDRALLRKEIDIAVHSLKDVPTTLPEDLGLIPVFNRADSSDVLVYKTDPEILFSQPTPLIATGSIRRKAQWLHRFPTHRITGLRGNVDNRLKQLTENPWEGAIFARAGLERIGILPENSLDLPWMIPCPAQGILAVACRKADARINEIIFSLSNPEVVLLAQVERDFLQCVEGGCMAPVGALAEIKGNDVFFKGCLLSLDGTTQLTVNRQSAREDAAELGQQAALQILENGGKQVIENIRRESHD
ncbi:MAG: hydroxymethylbilane synthase [Bacteroidia bacterium]|nr:hydroxymethylbilane synthase [Bacteroidia bacterium]